MTAPPFASRTRRGFTLVELLVVIAVIALLVALLLPALQRARDAATTAVCASNMRQVATLFNVYASDFRGHFPPTDRHRDSNPDALNPSWQPYRMAHALGPYLGHDAWDDQGMTSPHSFTTSDKQVLHRSVLVCPVYAGRLRPQDLGPTKLGTAESRYVGVNKGQTTLGPGMYTDGYPRQPLKTTSAPSLRVHLADSYDGTNLGERSNLLADANPVPFVYRRFDVSRHLGFTGANALYLDGHVTFRNRAHAIANLTDSFDLP